jgi:hypothetical protein
LPPDTINQQPRLVFVRRILVICFIFLVFTGLTKSYSVEVYSKEDSPFGLPLDQWLNKWWTWWVATNTDEATPKENGCLMNKNNSMVFLMETTVVGKYQVCDVSSKQGIMTPIWTAFMEDSFNEKGEQPHKGYSYEQLSKAAREEADLGAVTSNVKVDGREICKLDEVSSMKSGKLDFKINSMENVTELYSKGFNITIPPDTHYPDQNIGTWPSGAHGWFCLLKPLPPGDHTISYNVRVTGAGPEKATEITYALKVK